MDLGVGALPLGAEKGQIFVEIDGGGGADPTGLFHQGKQPIGVDLDPVQIGLAVHDHLKRRDGDIVLRYQLGGQITGAVGADADGLQTHSDTSPRVCFCYYMGGTSTLHQFGLNKS